MPCQLFLWRVLPSTFCAYNWLHLHLAVLVQLVKITSKLHFYPSIVSPAPKECVNKSINKGPLGALSTNFKWYIWLLSCATNLHRTCHKHVHSMGFTPSEQRHPGPASVRSHEWVYFRLFTNRTWEKTDGGHCNAGHPGRPLGLSTTSPQKPATVF